MTLLAIDPGRSFTGKGKARQSIGFSLFSLEEVGETGRQEWQEIQRGVQSWEELCRNLKVFEHRDWNGVGTDEYRLQFADWEIDEVVIEDFVNDPKSARGGQRNGTSECIGAVEILAIQAGVPFTRQRSAILGTAKLLADYQGKAKHLPHQDSAYLHGYYYLVQKGVLSSKGIQGTL